MTWPNSPTSRILLEFGCTGLLSGKFGDEMQAGKVVVLIDSMRFFRIFGDVVT